MQQVGASQQPTGQHTHLACQTRNSQRNTREPMRLVCVCVGQRGGYSPQCQKRTVNAVLQPLRNELV